MKIDYELIRLYHRIDSIYSDTDTRRRLQEVRDYRYPNSPEVKHLVKASLAKREHVTDTELKFYQNFPDHGLSLSATRSQPGLCSNALMFAASMPFGRKRDHTALIHLVRLQWLGIVRGQIETENGKKSLEILVKLR